MKKQGSGYFYQANQLGINPSLKETVKNRKSMVEVKDWLVVGEKQRLMVKARRLLVVVAEQQY